MTTAGDLLTDGLTRVRDVVRSVLDGLTDEQLAARVAPGTNPVGWLVWHLTRVQDDHLAEAAGREQAWTSGGWAERFGLDATDTGYGHTAEQVDGVRASADLLLGYHDAVAEASTAWVAGLSDADLARVVDDAYDPPVTLATRLVSVLQDDLMHAGQATYARGVLLR